MEAQAQAASIEHPVQAPADEQEFTIPRCVSSPPTVKSTNQSRRAVSDGEEAMWETWANEDEAFTMDEDPSTAADQKRQDFERRLDEFILWDGAEGISGGAAADGLEEIWDEAEQDDLLSEVLENLGGCSQHFSRPRMLILLTDLERDESLITTNNDTTEKEHLEWFPYPSKLVFLLDVVDNLPRLRISSSFMKALLWLLCELGIKHVPLFAALKKVQDEVRNNVGIPTIQKKSPKGNVYFFNDPCAIVANVGQFLKTSIRCSLKNLQDWANPQICDDIRRYPVIPSNG